MINRRDYPALYLKASEVAKQMQSESLRVVRLHVLLLATLALPVLNTNPHLWFAVVNAAAFLFAAWLSVDMNKKRRQQFWRSARTLAEAVKSASWRYMMSAQPYARNAIDDGANERFLQSLKTRLAMTPGVAEREDFLAQLEKPISKAMMDVRGASLKDRKACYLSRRIDDQIRFYQNSERRKNRAGRGWYVALVCLQITAALLIVGRAVCPVLPGGLPELIGVTAGGIVAWLQINRFEELAQTYGVAAEQIGQIRQDIVAVESDAVLAALVEAAENIFEAEHQQWAKT